MRTTPPRARFGRSPGALAAGALLALLLWAPRTAVAQTYLQFDGSLDLSYGSTTPITPDSQQLSLQIRPAVTFQTGSTRLVWRIGYLFAGSLGLYGLGEATYANELATTLVAQTSNRTLLAFTAGLVQGDTAFQLTQRPADAGQPTFRPPGSPAQITASASETFTWEASAESRLVQALTWSFVAPQYDVDLSSQQLAALLSYTFTRGTDSWGGELAPSVARLQPLVAGELPYISTIHSLVGRWGRDLGQNWSGLLRVGVATVMQFTGSYPLAIVPVGGIEAGYLGERVAGSASLTYGPRTELGTATVTQAGQLIVRGVYNFDTQMTRQLAASAGFVRSRPLGEVNPLYAVGTGDILQGDLGFVWALTSSILVSARYSVAYQYMQPLGIPPSLTHALLIGVTGRYQTAGALPPMPGLGQRVDGSDAVNFPGDEPRRRRPPAQ